MRQNLFVDVVIVNNQYAGLFQMFVHTLSKNVCFFETMKPKRCFDLS